MKEVLIESYEVWRSQARLLLRDGLAPDSVHFSSIHLGQPVLQFAEPEEPRPAQTSQVPREFLDLSKTAGCHREPERWNMLYRALWRLSHGEPHLLRDHADSAIRDLRLMEKAVHRDMHKMRAFVRFREMAGPSFIAWHRPDHYIVRANAPFFVRRFGSMRWAILTPDESVYWDTEELRFGPGLPRDAAPDEDRLEELWLTYYQSIFNPARLNIAAMTAEMPVRHWATLPEAQVINNLLRNADRRVASMVMEQPTSAKLFVPAEADLTELRAAARRCEGCELYRDATQTVFGEGPERAQVVMVGEQPGDQEDLSGKPFVGPAGKLLDRALEEAGVDRSSVYMTNAVKHFRFEERGKRRIHKKASGSQISACRPWLEAELASIRPRLIVCLGATAAQSLVGKDVRIQVDRGRMMETKWAERLMVTIHPSALLRVDPAMFEAEYAKFVADLKLINE